MLKSPDSTDEEINAHKHGNLPKIALIEGRTGTSSHIPVE